MLIYIHLALAPALVALASWAIVRTWRDYGAAMIRASLPPHDPAARFTIRQLGRKD